MQILLSIMLNSPFPDNRDDSNCCNHSSVQKSCYTFVCMIPGERAPVKRPSVSLKTSISPFFPMCYVMVILRSMISCMACTRLDITADKDHQSLPVRISASYEPCLRWAFYRFSFPLIVLCSIWLGNKPRAVLTTANSELWLYEYVQCFRGHCFQDCSTSEVRPVEVYDQQHARL